ncbi:hypothetical protein EDC94DRAFT_660040 [Helicostylum pulchrum]|nr:hypothetical protein EDC94DRAFT_660040 [Helicostylum pulchrum]
MELKDSNNVVRWSDIVTACRADIVQDFATYSTDTTCNLKGVWKYQDVAPESSFTKNSLLDPYDQSSERGSSNTYKSSNTDESSNTDKFSKSSRLGYKLTSTDKANITNLYTSLERDRMWKLSTGRYVEDVINLFNLKLGYEHPSCSLILDLDDQNWINVFSREELDEVKKKCVEKNMNLQFPKKKIQDFLDEIPKTTDVLEVFNHINNIVIDPATDQGLYWLKMTIQQAADDLRLLGIPHHDGGNWINVGYVWKSPGNESVATRQAFLKAMIKKLRNRCLCRYIFASTSSTSSSPILERDFSVDDNTNSNSIKAARLAYCDGDTQQMIDFIGHSIKKIRL